jgi:hypothetical protein
LSIVGTHVSDTNHTLEWRLDAETEGTVWSESKRRSNEVREYEFSTTPICLPALVIGLAAGTTYSTKVQTSQTQQLIQGIYHVALSFPCIELSRQSTVSNLVGLLEGVLIL